jgi:hypothetical protein
MNWQPIETAPKDGKIFLAIDSSHHYYFAFWCTWMKAWKDAYQQVDAEYWMPLPEPPAEEKK